MDEKEKLIQSLVDEGYLKTPRIIEAFRAIDRADFVRPEHLSEAYGNYPLPIGEGQTISQPLTVAFMLELLDPQPGEKILDIGSGSGWTTVLLAHIVSQFSEVSPPKIGKVIGIERMPELCEFGKKNLAKYFDPSRAKIICGDGTQGLPAEAPFDKILAGAAASREIPQTWRDQLKVGGRIVAPVGGSILRFTKKSDQEWQEEEFPGFAFVPLVSNQKLKIKNQNDNVKLKNINEVSPYKSHKFWLIGLFLTLTVGVGFTANEIYRPHAAQSGVKTVEIASGLGSRQIAEILKKEGVIRSKWAFIIYISLKSRASDLRPGSYVFEQANIPEIVGDLVRGGTNEVALVIPEGWTVRKIAERLDDLGIASENDFMAIVKNVQHRVLNKFDFLNDKPKNAGLEGYLFPDTYRIFKDATAESIAVKILENFGRKFAPELREETSRQKKTIFEIVTMASLIEKEVVSDEDRAIVSGILWKRLDGGIALQVDATVNYLTGKKTTKVSLEDTKIDSPYNTYKYRGLPAGPIGNPGISAMGAALYPQKSPYLYYLSTPDGKTIFSRTLEEHNIAKGKYLK